MKMDSWGLAVIRQLIRTKFEQFIEKNRFLIQFMKDNVMLLQMALCV